MRLLSLAAAALSVFFAPASRAATRPSLALLDRAPIVLRGRSFVPGERVRVTVSTTVRRTRDVRAGSRGGFTVRFTGLIVPRCGGFIARARGSSGDLATMKIPLPACQPD
jgi:hypothetical protein